jgi:hypothetical protein
MGGESSLDLLLFRRHRQGLEIEVVRILENVLCRIRVRRGQRSLEAG